MPRETVVLIVPEFPGTRNRDKGKLFRITEWSAAKADNWGQRMMYAANSGAGELPTSLAGIGLEGIAILGINVFLRGNIAPGTMIPLLDELLECVKIIRDHAKPDVATDIVSEDDIEEVATRWWLRGEVLTLHLNFSVSAALSALFKKIMVPTKDPLDSSSPSTSPGALQ